MASKRMGMVIVVGDGLKKYGKFIQQVKRMAAVVSELQRAFQCHRAASDIEMA